RCRLLSSCLSCDSLAARYHGTLTISTTLPPSPDIYPLSYTTLFRSQCEQVERLLGREHDARPAPRPHNHAGEHLGQRGCAAVARSEEHTSELQSRVDLVCRLLLEKKKARRDSRDI